MNVLTSIMNVMNDQQVRLGPDERGFVYAIARRIVRAPDDADDVTQDALLLAHRHRDSFRGDSRYRTWLYRIAISTALGFLRRQKRRQKHARCEPLHDGLADLGCSVEATIAIAEEYAQVERAVAALARPYREVLLARVDATEPEVAARLGITLANVKVRTHRARKRLRRALATPHAAGSPGPREPTPPHASARRRSTTTTAATATALAMTR